MFSILHLQYCVTTSFSNDFCFGRLLFGYLFLLWIGWYCGSGFGYLRPKIILVWPVDPRMQRDYPLVPFYVPLALEGLYLWLLDELVMFASPCWSGVLWAVPCDLWDQRLCLPEWMWCYLVAVPLTMHQCPIAAYILCFQINYWCPFERSYDDVIIHQQHSNCPWFSVAFFFLVHRISGCKR